MDQLLKDIQARLIERVPALKYVDEDWGQLDYYSPHPPVQWPCGLIDATSADWSDILKKVQMGLVQVTIRVGDLKLTNTSGKAPAGQKQHAFEIFATLKEVYKALHGWTGSKHYSRLMRKTSRRVKREDGVRIYEMIFTCELTDNSAMDAQVTTPGTPKFIP
jgi:hypothetical protein